jgi:hypothetical protein
MVPGGVCPGSLNGDVVRIDAGLPVAPVRCMVLVQEMPTPAPRTHVLTEHDLLGPCQSRPHSVTQSIVGHCDLMDTDTTCPSDPTGKGGKGADKEENIAIAPSQKAWWEGTRQ